MIFERFYRIENQVHKIKGTGLGLHLVKIAIEKHHGGRVFVNSKVNEGSTFGFWLPIDKADVKEPQKIQTPKDMIKNDIQEFKIEKAQDYSKKVEHDAKVVGIKELPPLDDEPEKEQKLVFNEINNPVVEENQQPQQEEEIMATTENKEEEWEITFEVRD